MQCLVLMSTRLCTESLGFLRAIIEGRKLNVDLLIVMLGWQVRGGGGGMGVWLTRAWVWVWGVEGVGGLGVWGMADEEV